VQWADPATLDLLLYLAGSLAEQPAPVLLLFTLSTSGEGFAEAQSRWVMALKRTRLPLTARVLAAFTQEETQRFVRALLRAEQPPAVGESCSSDGGPERREAAPYRDVLEPFANWLSVQTRGQPLYLVETLKELRAREILVPAPGERGSWCLVLRTGLLAETPVGELIPSSVRELIRSQLARLSPSAWTLLMAGAVVGQGLSFERLIGVARLDEQEGLCALEELLRQGLLREGTPGEEAQASDGYAFPREMMRQVISQEAGATRQRLVRQRALLVMREETEDNEDGESRLPSPVSGGSSAFVETRNGHGRPVAARLAQGGRHEAVAKDTWGATRRQSGRWMGEHTLPAARGAWRQAALDFPRSPPGSSFRAFLLRAQEGNRDERDHAALSSAAQPGQIPTRAGMQSG
jgi:hypothetical protein